MNEDKELEEAIKELRHNNKELEDSYELHHCSWAKKILERSDKAIESILNELKIKDKQILFYKKLYEDLKNDFENYKKDKDINYLDGIHHKKLVEKSIGQTIDKPEECWFDTVEVKIIIDDKLYNVDRKKDFITLKDISDKEPNKCTTVIAESPLSGAIYRYNNYGKREWQLIGTMLGYA